MGSTARTSPASDATTLVTDALAPIIGAKDVCELNTALEKLSSIDSDGSLCTLLNSAVVENKKSVTKCLMKAIESNGLSDEASEVADMLLTMAQKPPEVETLNIVVDLSPSTETRGFLLDETDDTITLIPDSPRLALSITLPPPREVSRSSVSPVPFMLWPSSLMLAKALLSAPELIRGQRILELGCGAHGVVGGAAVQVGAETLHLTDINSEAVRLTEQNLLRNFPNSHCTECFTLDWSSAQDSNSSKPDQYSVVLGADIIHSEEMPALVMQALKTFLAPGGTALFMNAGAKHRFGIEKFQALLKDDPELAHRSMSIDPQNCLELKDCELHEGICEYDLYQVWWRSGR